MAFVDALVQKGILNRYQVDDLMARSRQLEGGIDEALLQAGIQEKAIVETKSEYYGLPIGKVSLSKTFDTLGYVPEAAALHYQFVPIGMEGEDLLIGMIDPPRPEVIPALEVGRKAGIRTVMITGDYPNTARSISESINLLEPGHQVMTGAAVG